MGLLDSFDSPQMALAAGLLGGGNFGTALGRGMANSQAVQLAEQRKREMEAQAMERQAMAEQRQAQMAMAQAKFKMQQDALNGVGGQQGTMNAPSSQGGPFMSQGGPLMVGSQSGGSQGVGDMSAQLDRLERMAIAGVPGAKESLDILKYRNTPQQLQAGSFYQTPGGQREYVGDPTKGLTMGPNGITRMPGSENIAGMAGDVARAQEQAKAGVDVVKVPTGNGDQTVDMNRDDYTRFLRNRGNPQAAPQVRPAQPQPGVMGSGYAGGNRDSANADSIQMMESELRRDPNMAPDLKAGIQREIARMQQQSGVPTLGMTQDPAEASRRKLSGEAGGKINDTWLKTSYEPAITSGNASQQSLENIKAAKSSLSGLGQTGWGTEAKATAANVLTTLGLAPANATMFASNAQKFQSVAMDNLWTKLNAAKGPQTEGDSDRAQKTWAKLSNTPQANQYILDLAQARAEREIMKARFFSAGLPVAQKSGNLQELDNEWSKRMPSVFEMPSMQAYK